MTSDTLNNWPEFATAFASLTRELRAHLVDTYLGERLARSLSHQRNQACMIIEEIWRGNIERGEFLGRMGGVDNVSYIFA